MNSMTGKDYNIEVFTSLDDVGQRWVALERAGHASPFQSFAWCRALYDHIGRPRGVEPAVVMVSDASGGADVMLLALWVCRDPGGRRKIAFFDLGVSDYEAPVLAASSAPDAAAMRALWPRIVEKLPRADYLHFSTVPAKIGALPNPLLGVCETRLCGMKSYGLRLPENWDDYRLHVLSRSTRKSINQKWNKLGRAGKTAFVHADTPQRAGAFFDVLLEQRRARFAVLGRREILNEADYVSFYRALITSTNPDTPGLITALTVDGKIIALLYGLIYKRTYSMLLSSFDGGWGRYSPGLLINEAMMRWLHERGISAYDFTIGSEPYKQQLGGREHDLYEIMQPFSLSGRALKTVSSAKRGVKSLLGKI